MKTVKVIVYARDVLELSLPDELAEQFEARNNMSEEESMKGYYNKKVFENYPLDEKAIDQAVESQFDQTKIVVSRPLECNFINERK